LCQDVPFCVLNTILLDRTINRRHDLNLSPTQRLCSDEFKTDFLLLLLVLLTSVAALVWKLMHLPALPRLWAEHRQLAEEAVELAQHLAAMEVEAHSCPPGAAGETETSKQMLYAKVDAVLDRCVADVLAVKIS
jgi:hypothetical protein